MTKPKLTIPKRPIAKRMDRWIEFPAKPASCTELNAHYNEVVQLAKKDPFYKKYFGGVAYYFVTFRYNREIRDFVCDNYKDCGFKIKVVGDNIWAKKKD
jgi:hypothetical protein